ncbi:MAG: TIGR00730 family Rossman fold protein, partial [Parcubacteria group bacterium]|nr:TIGR00730 family Rossman fold protein [Parcubacteria group bacterium]
MADKTKQHFALYDFTKSIDWQIFKIMAEFVSGFEFLADLKKEITFFGSARFKEGHPDYQKARELAGRLGKAGFTVITGGGPGIMEAANRGSFEAGAQSVGLNIQLPMEQRINPYVKKGIGFYYFFTRKVMLSVSSQAYVFFPGGYGTLDELLEMVTLVHLKIIQNVPIVLVGREFWATWVDFIGEVVHQKIKAVDKKDLKIFTLVDSIDEPYDILSKTQERPYMD